MVTAVGSALGLSAAQVEQALAAAAQAPSLYDTQPWRFRIRRELIELHTDPARRLPATDPDGLEQRLSCGAALLNLRLELRGLGVRPLVSLLPDGLAARGSSALAAIRDGGRAGMTPELVRLQAAVPAVRLARGPVRNVPVLAEQRIALTRAVQEERSWLHTVADARDRVTLSSLVSRAWQRQQADVAAQAELAAWTGHGGLNPPGREGRPPDGLGDSPPGEAAENGLGAAPVDDSRPDSFVIMLCSFHSGPSAEVQSGQALQRLLLAATTLGLMASSLSLLLAVPDLRTALRRELGTPMHPHAILRLGLGAPAPHPPSRPVSDLVIAESDDI